MEFQRNEITHSFHLEAVLRGTTLSMELFMGTELPTEHELNEPYDVTRVKVREARRRRW
jgi:DNA-binding FadR family transcriptional regulator